MRRSNFSGLLLSISVLALSACAGGEPQGIEASKSTAPVPPIASLDEGLDDTLTPVSSSTAKTETTVTTTTAQTGSVEARMEKLEQAVGSLRTDYDRIMPAFASLNTTNERIQTLLDEIEDQNGGTSATPTHNVMSAPVSAPAPVSTTISTTTTERVTPAPGTVSPAMKPTAQDIARPSPEVMKAMDDMAAPKPVSTAVTTTTTTTTADVPPQAIKPAAATTSSVKGVRIGEHESKTRLVIDLGASAKPEMKQDLDNTEKLLLVDLPASHWEGAKSGTPKSSAFITSWSVQDGANGGSSLAIQLKKPAKIVSTQYLKAEGKDPARLVIDLGPAT